MDFYKLISLVLVIVLVISIITFAIFISSDSDENNDIIVLENELKMLNESLHDNITRLFLIEQELNSSESFLMSYLKGLGTFYSAVELEESVDYKFDESMQRYDSGYWSNALAWFWDTSKWCDDANEKYLEARDIFIETGKYTLNETYKSICSLYADMMNVSSLSLVYLNEASDLYASSCEYYLDGQYSDAHNSKDNAELKLSYYEEEKSNFDEYQLELQDILMEIL
jgi:hypothetical protein